MNHKSLILVIGGTGTQGGNVARELLKHGHRVRVLSRNPESAAAAQIAQLGAEVVQGNLGDAASLAAAMQGVTAIFSVPLLDLHDPTVETSNAANLVSAAQSAGVQQVIHTSVIGSNQFPRWDKSSILSHNWENKYKVEEYIRHGGFQYWTILHPSWFMENLAQPLAAFMAPELKHGKLFGVLYPDTPLKLSCGEDIARFARAGFEDPEKFHAKDINIAGDELSSVEMAALITEVSGKKVVYEEVTKEAGIKRGLLEGTAQSHQWMNEVPGWGFDLNETKAYGIQLKPLREWLEENKSRLDID